MKVIFTLTTVCGRKACNENSMVPEENKKADKKTCNKLFIGTQVSAEIGEMKYQYVI